MTETAPEYDPTKPLWSIMTKSRGGTVSVIKDLTEEQARKTYERLDPWYGQHSDYMKVHKDFLADGVLGSGYGFGVSTYRNLNDGDIEIREVFGPAGWKRFGGLEHWPKTYAIYTDAQGKILPAEYQEHEDRAASQRLRAEYDAEIKTKRAELDRQSKADEPKQASSEYGWVSKIFGGKVA